MVWKRLNEVCSSLPYNQVVLPPFDWESRPCLCPAFPETKLHRTSKLYGNLLSFDITERRTNRTSPSLWRQDGSCGRFWWDWKSQRKCEAANKQLLPGHPLQPQTLATDASWPSWLNRGKDSRCLASWRNKSTESTESSTLAENGRLDVRN
jgi:hypothetical protein